MKVLKFGGTSVGTAESLKNVRSIAEHIEGSAIIVVSALGGLTDRLLAMARSASEGKEEYKTEMVAVRKRHHDIIDELVPENLKPELTVRIDTLLDELQRNYDGVMLLGELSERTSDAIVSFGERMSSLIVSCIIPGAIHIDSLEIIKTEKWFNKNIADVKNTDANIKEAFADMPENQLYVMGGFISKDGETGDITNLGRGGSDYTAALVAAALDADVLEIWTDVDGFMTADPRIIPQAFVMSHLTFIESMELCSFGAKVIYPPTIYPVFHKNIPIRILNTHNPDAPGTWIDDVADSNATTIKGISSIKETALITLTGTLAKNVARVNSRTYNAMAKKGINVYLVSAPGEEKGFSFAVGSADLIEAMRILIEEFTPELSEGSLKSIEPKPHLSTIAVVGENISSNTGLCPRLINTLERENIRVHATSGSSSATTVTLMVDENHLHESLKLIHASVFE